MEIENERQRKKIKRLKRVNKVKYKYTHIYAQRTHKSIYTQSKSPEQFILFKKLYTHYLYPVELSMNRFFGPIPLRVQSGFSKSYGREKASVKKRESEKEKKI